MNILVTGATGFIGREVTARLSGRAHSLALLVRGPRAEQRIAAMGLSGSVIEGDLEDAHALDRAVHGIDAVVHLAAIVSPALQRDTGSVRRVNRDGAVMLARAAQRAGARRFVFVSSIAAMGFFSGVATKDSICRPVTDYGRAKLEAERALLEMRASAFDVIVLRPPTVYGPGESYNFLEWVRAIHRGMFRVIGHGNNRFPLATTENVARAACAAAEGQLPGDVYLVADREPYSVKRIHDAVLATLGKRRPMLRIPHPLALGAALVNEGLRSIAPQVPAVLTRARVNTLTVDQRFDLTLLIQAGVPLDAPLEKWVALTIRDYERRRVL